MNLVDLLIIQPIERKELYQEKFLNQIHCAILASLIKLSLKSILTIQQFINYQKL